MTNGHLKELLDLYNGVQNMKIRFIEPGNRPYRKSLLNHFVYDHYIRTPSQGIITLATILHKKYAEDHRMARHRNQGNRQFS